MKEAQLALGFLDGSIPYELFSLVLVGWKGRDNQEGWSFERKGDRLGLECD